MSTVFDHTARDLGFGSFGARGSVADPRAARWVMRNPTTDDLTEALLERIRREQVQPALEASTRERFWARMLLEMPTFVRRFLALEELQPSETGNEDATAELTRAAAEFGGTTWEDALHDSSEDVERARRVFSRLDLSRTDDAIANNVLAYAGAVFAWVWGVACFGVMVDSPDRVDADIQEEVRRLLMESGQAAYVAARSIELLLGREQEDSQEALFGFPEHPSDDEERRLLDAADEDTRLLLNKIDT